MPDHPIHGFITKGVALTSAPHFSALRPSERVRKGLTADMQAELAAEAAAARRRQPTPEEEAGMAKRRKRWDMGFW